MSLSIKINYTSKYCHLNCFIQLPLINGVIYATCPSPPITQTQVEIAVGLWTFSKQLQVMTIFHLYAADLSDQIDRAFIWDSFRENCPTVKML